MAMVDKVNEGAYLHVQGGTGGVGLFHAPHVWRFAPRLEPEPAARTMRGVGR
jgi:hypothetical protein